MIFNWRYSVPLLFVAIFCVLVVPVFSWAMKLTDINVSNGFTESKVILSFDQRPVYDFFLLQDPERLVLDVRQSGTVSGLPLAFREPHLLKKIRSSQPRDTQSTRLVFDLTRKVKTNVLAKQAGNVYQVIFTLIAEGKTPAREIASMLQPKSSSESNNPFNNQPVGIGKNSVGTVTTGVTTTGMMTTGSARTVKTAGSSVSNRGASGLVIVAIDAGHGGQDPGAVGQNGLQERHVTISVARKLAALLDNDPLFKPVLTRNGDYFLSVMGRSDVARKQKANVLVSIHADAAPNRRARGASVWVLSNRRANSELGNWLEQHEKQSELLGGAGDLLASPSADPYLSKAVLDLQFGHSQRVGYAIAASMLRELKRVGSIHKVEPEHASLGVLRSPDIPSVLVETGFISNSMEERLLGSDEYQGKIAQAIYQGLRNYFLAHPLQVSPTRR